VQVQGWVGGSDGMWRWVGEGWEWAGKGVGGYRNLWDVSHQGERICYMKPIAHSCCIIRGGGAVPSSSLLFDICCCPHLKPPTLYNPSCGVCVGFCCSVQQCAATACGPPLPASPELLNSSSEIAPPLPTLTHPLSHPLQDPHPLTPTLYPHPRLQSFSTAQVSSLPPFPTLYSTPLTTPLHRTCVQTRQS